MLSDGPDDSRVKVLQAQDLYVSFPPLHVLDGFSLSTGYNEVVVLVGPSGAGKSTLLDCLTGLRAPDAGTVTTGYARHETAYLMQDTALLPWRSLLGNALVGAAIMGLKIPSQNAKELLELMGVSPNTLLPNEASEGMRQRTALVRTLLHRPKLVFLDEPFSHIDLPRKLSLQRWFLSLVKDQETSAIIVTHDLEDAITIGDRVLILHGPPLRIHKEISVATLRGSIDPIELRSRPIFGELFSALWSGVNARDTL